MVEVWAEVKNKIRRWVKRNLPPLCVSLLIVTLMAFTLYNCLDLSAVSVQTTPAVRSTEYEIAGLTGYVFRDERVLYSRYSGASVYRVGDGERVSVGTLLARTYASGNTADYLERRRAIEKKIDLLERSVRAGRLSTAGVDETRRLTGGVYGRIMNSIAQGEYSAAASLGEELLVGLNAYDVITGKNEGLADELSAARGLLSSLENSYTGEYESITNAESGYFYYGSDGYESVFDYDSIFSLTPERLSEMTASPPLPDGKAGRYAVGRIIGDYIWYLAVPADAELCRRLEGNTVRSVTFPDSGGMTIDMELERISYSADGSDGVLIFSSGYIPAGFNFGRTQKIELLVSELSGFRVPVSAVRELRGIKGVYVLASSNMIFRKINIIYEGDGYVVAAYRNMSAENYGEYLDLNDDIIISVSDGNIFEGRVLD